MFWGSIYTTLLKLGSRKQINGVFFSVFSNSQVFWPKCLEDPKQFPMLPSPPQHDRQRCPVADAATATAPTTIDFSAKTPWPQRYHWSLRHRRWGVSMASVPVIPLTFHPSRIFVSKQSNISTSSFFIHHSKRVRSMVVLEPSPTNSNQAVQQMKCFWPSPPLLTHADAAVERPHGRL